MTATQRSWLVLLRDISHAVRIPNEARIVASLVFEMETGLVLGSGIGASEQRALELACEAALVGPPEGLLPGRPDRVLCNPGLEELLAGELSKLEQALPLPPIAGVPPVNEAEDVFDSFVGHFAGRRDAEKFAAPGDWQLLFGKAARFYERRVWARWADDVDLSIEIGIGDHKATYTVIVLGHEGIQYGVVLYPGVSSPAGLRDAVDPSSVMPAGTLMLNYDPPEHVPEEFVMKAHRYGWPQGAELVPVLLTVGEGKPGEPGRDDLHLLTVALAAMLEHDATGPSLVEHGPPLTSGSVQLADGETASFSIRQRPSEESDAEDKLMLHVAGTDLLPVGTPVQIGSTGTGGLAALRRQARIHRPLPAGSPRPTGGEVAMLIVITDEAHGDEIAGRLAALDPYGISLAGLESHVVLALVGGSGAELLMELPARDPALRRFRSRLKAMKGTHVVLVADEGAASGHGAVYGLFECHIPAGPPKHKSRGSSPAARPKSPKSP
ncbi:MAG: hypothetical protein ACRDZ5_04335 [Acidimicrobiales bacterium]